MMAANAGTSFVWGDGGEALSPSAIEQQRRMAMAMLMQDRGQPMGWSQGLADAAKSVMAAMMMRRLDAADRGNAQYNQGILKELFGGNPAATPGMNIPPRADAPVDTLKADAGAPPPPSPMGPVWPGESTSSAVPGGTARQIGWQGEQPSGGMDAFQKSISNIESGGRYNLLGPLTKGDRAYGKYQVMGNNIPSWTEAALGKRMTPQEFLASPQAQDAVFNHRFGSYVNKYGPEGAAKAWFAGEGGMKNPNARDVLGTSVSSYAQKFMRGLGGSSSANAAPMQVASLNGAVPQESPLAAPAVNIEQQAAMSQAEPSWQEASAFPNFAPPQRQAPQASPAVQQVAQAMQPNTQRMMMMMGDPRVSPDTKRVIELMLQRQMQAGQVSAVDAGDRLLMMDKNGNIVRTVPKGEPVKGPTFGDIGVDPHTGEPVKGFIDPSRQSITPYSLPNQSGQPSAIPPVQPGVDPKIHRKAWSERLTSEGMPASFEDTSKVRKEIQELPSYKNIAQAAPVYKSMLDAAGRDNRAADVNLIYGMAKIMDPGSVVRESEMTVAQAVATLPQQLRATIESQLTATGRLSPDVRAAIMQEAHSRLSAYQGMFDQDAAMFRTIAKNRRMREDEVIPMFGPFEQYKLPEPKGAGASGGWTVMDGGVRIREKK